MTDHETHLHALPWPRVMVHKYPDDLGSPPYEKQMLFEVKVARHLGRRRTVGEAEGVDRNVAAAALYMPVDALNSTTTVDWSPEDIGIAGGAMIDAFTQGGPATGANIMEKLGTTAKAYGGALGVDLVAKIITPLISAATAGGNGEAILQSMLGQKIDPRTDMLFGGVQYRKHQFSFTLIPRNQIEAESINSILNIFQFYMLPRYGAGTATLDSYFIGYPYEFDITMITKEGLAAGGADDASLHINKIDRSVLTSCNINHAGANRVAFMGNYYPAATSLVLDFTEVRLQGRDRYGEAMWHGSDATPFDPNRPMTGDDVKDGVKGGVAAFKGLVKDFADSTLARFNGNDQ
jgi:hypothetical protein